MRKDERVILADLSRRLNTLNEILSANSGKSIQVNHSVTQERIPHPDHIVIVARAPDGQEWRYPVSVTRNSRSPMIQVPPWTMGKPISHPPLNMYLEFH